MTTKKIQEAFANLEFSKTACPCGCSTVLVLVQETKRSSHKFFFTKSTMARRKVYLEFLLQRRPSSDGLPNCQSLFRRSKRYSHESAVSRSRKASQVFPSRHRCAADYITIESMHCDGVHIADLFHIVNKKFDQNFCVLQLIKNSFRYSLHITLCL
jgi:hypothetical protein